MYCITHNKQMIHINERSCFLNGEFNKEYMLFLTESERIFKYVKNIFACTKFSTKEEAETKILEIKKVTETMLVQSQKIADKLNKLGFGNYNQKRYRYDYSNLDKSIVRKHFACFRIYGVSPHNIFLLFNNVDYCDKTISGYEIIEVSNQNLVYLNKNAKQKFDIKYNSSSDSVHTKRSYHACSRCGAALMDVNYIIAYKNGWQTIAICPFCIKQLAEGAEKEINKLSKDVVNDYYSQVLTEAL